MVMSKKTTGLLMMLERLRDPTHTHTRVSAQGPGFGGAQMKAAAHQVTRAFVGNCEVAVPPPAVPP